MNICIEKPFSYLNILCDTIKFILPPNSNYSIRFQQIVIDFDDKHIIILQLVNWIIINYNDKDVVKQLRINVNTYFKPQICNFYVAYENLEKMKVFYQQQKMNQLVSIIACRVLDKQTENMLIKAFESKLICYKIISFLAPKDYSKLPLICSKLMEIFCCNNFWFNLYNWKFGLTGFDINSLEWKKQYILKSRK